MFETVEKALNWIRNNAKAHAEAKAKRVYLEQFRKTKKAILIQNAPDTCRTVQDKESYAYAHQEYQEVLNGLREAVEAEEELKFLLKAAELKFEQWRTMQANERVERGRYNA